MKPVYFNIYLLCLLCVTATARAQLSVAAGETLFTKSGETLHADGLTLYPSADFTLTNNTLTRNSVVVHPLPGSYVLRTHQFSSNTAGFSGSIRVNYQQDELNGLPEAAITVHVHDGSSWQSVTTASADLSTNYVWSNPVSNLVLNEITLTNALSTLPLQWRLFSADKKEKNAFLQWITTREQDTKDFIVEHSPDGSRWEQLGTVPAGGLMSDNRYTYTHLSPGAGKHFYRLLQRDHSGKSSYSPVQMLLFSTPSSFFSYYPNPVYEGQLNLLLQQPAILTLYNSAGILILRKDLPSGTNQLRLSHLPKGIYYISVGQEMGEIVIQ